MHNGSLLFILLSKRKKKKTINFSHARVIVVGMNVPSAQVSLYRQFAQHDIRSVFQDLGLFSAVPFFRIWGYFPPFHILGYGDIFRRSVFQDLKSFSAIPSFRLLGLPRKSGFCNHTLALITKVFKYSLYYCKDFRDLKDEEDENPSTVCTSKLQNWHRPRMDGVSFATCHAGSYLQSC